MIARCPRDVAMPGHFLGLGIMGSRMAANLARAGHELTVWNRTRERADEFAARASGDRRRDPGRGRRGGRADHLDGRRRPAGAGFCWSGRAGSRTAPRRGAVCVDCSTIGPAWAREIARACTPAASASRRPGHRIGAEGRGRNADDHGRGRDRRPRPGPAGARGDGRADRPLRDRSARARWSSSSTTPWRRSTPRRSRRRWCSAPPPGSTSMPSTEVMAAGSGASAMLALKAGPMRRHDFAPLFKLDHMLKDVELCLDEAGRPGVPFALGGADPRRAGRRQRTGLRRAGLRRAARGRRAGRGARPSDPLKLHL